MILTPNVEGQGVLDRTEEGAEANLLYLRDVYIWGGKRKTGSFLIKGQVQRSPQGFYYRAVAS